MNRPQRLIQAYRQAPWRKQVQWIVFFAATVIFIAVVAGIYLNVTARAATIGREIQDMQDDKHAIQQKIEDLETRLALLTSAGEMEKRAREMGFEQGNKEESIYLLVLGNGGRQMAAFALPPGPTTFSGHTLPPEFTLSLIDWARDMVSQLALQYGTPLEVISP